MDQATRIETAGHAGVDLAAPPSFARMRGKPRAGSTDAALRFRRVTGRKGLLSIERVWRRITAAWSTAQHYQSYDWYSLYLDALEYHENDWHFIVVYRHYVPVGIVPLRYTRTMVHGVRVQALELPDHPHVPFADLIITELPGHAFIAAFIRYLQNSGLDWDALILRRVTDDSLALRLFGPDRALTCVTNSHHRVLRAAPANEAAADGRTHEQPALPGSIRYEACGNKPLLYRSFAVFLGLEASGWQGHAGLRGAIRDDSRLVRYYRRLIDVFGDGACEIGLLKLDGQPIAAQFCLLSHDTRYVLKTGYDAACAHLAPARLLLEASMRRAASEGRERRFIAASPWHNADPRSRATFDVHRFNTTRRGLSAFACMRAAQTLQPARRDYRDLRRAARRRLRQSIAHISRAVDQYLRCP